MRLPERPPQLSKQLSFPINAEAIDAPEIRKYIDRANAKYSHWDDLKHRPPPLSMTPAQGWQLVKVARYAQRRTLPLLDENGRPFSYGLPVRMMETLHEVDRHGGSSLALDGEIVPSLEATKEQVLVSSLMEEAIATSQIEGAVTTRRVAKEMLRTNRRPRDRSEQMIANSYETIQLLSKRKDRPLSLELLFEIQRTMTKDTLDDETQVGRLRTEADGIEIIDVSDAKVLFTPPPARQLQARVAKLISFANDPSPEWIHPLVKAAILHFWLAYEHPFVDGNGRTARALFYWLMLKNKYWLFEFLTVSKVIADSRLAYYRSFLYSEHDDNDLTYSLVYQIDATKKALGNLRAYLRKKQDEQSTLARTLRGMPDLNHRQRELLRHAMQHPEQFYTFQSHQRSQGVTYVTARADLLDLVARGLMSQTRQGRQRAFFAADDMSKKLRGSRQIGRTSRR